jgi:hypothetical protein
MLKDTHGVGFVLFLYVNPARVCQRGSAVRSDQTAETTPEGIEALEGKEKWRSAELI